MNKFNKNITLADIFLEALSKSQDNATKIIAERIKATIKSPEISEFVNICVINALGYRSIIKESVVDKAIDGIISLVHSEIDSCNLPDYEKSNEKDSYKYFAKGVGEVVKQWLKDSNQLVS